MNAVHVRVRLGGESYAVAVENVIEVAELGTMSPYRERKVRSWASGIFAARSCRSSIFPPSSESGATASPSASSSPSTAAFAPASRSRGHRRRRAPPVTEETQSKLLVGAALDDFGLIGVVDIERLSLRWPWKHDHRRIRRRSRVPRLFRDEANERLDSMVDTLLALESGGADPDSINSVFRDVHSIKGGAAMLGLETVRDLAHMVEDVLSQARSAGQFPTQLAEPLLRSTDALRGT